MKIRMLAVAAALGLAALDAGAAVAHADPAVPPSQPSPPPTQSAQTRPGVNPGWSATPLVPGLGSMSPLAHRGLAGVVPMWAPPSPRPPEWAPWLPVAWNSELSAWGVWWNGVFVRL